MEEIFNGVIPDPRSEEQKDRDFPHAEIAGAVIVEWREKPESEWKKYTQRIQNGSGTCVAQSSAKAIETVLNDVFSALPIYQKRKNSGYGMYLQDAGDILKKYFTVKEADAPSQHMTEAQANILQNFDAIKDRYGIDGYVFCSSFEETVQAIAMGKAVLLTFGSSNAEWTEMPVYNGTPPTWYHCITGVDYASINGVHCIICEDSAVASGRRLITQAFYANRNTGAMYFLNPKKLDGKIHHTFNQILIYGMKNEEVKALQTILKQDGCMPSEINSTGFYGNATAHAVDKFQRKYQVAPVAELDVLQGKRVGQRTLAKLNELYA